MPSQKISLLQTHQRRWIHHFRLWAYSLKTNGFRSRKWLIIKKRTIWTLFLHLEKLFEFSRSYSWMTFSMSVLTYVKYSCISISTPFWIWSIDVKNCHLHLYTADMGSSYLMSFNSFFFFRTHVNSMWRSTVTSFSFEVFLPVVQLLYKAR